MSIRPYGLSQFTVSPKSFTTCYLTPPILEFFACLVSYSHFGLSINFKHQSIIFTLSRLVSLGLCQSLSLSCSNNKIRSSSQKTACKFQHFFTFCEFESRWKSKRLSCSKFVEFFIYYSFNQQLLKLNWFQQFEQFDIKWNCINWIFIVVCKPARTVIAWELGIKWNVKFENSNVNFALFWRK